MLSVALLLFACGGDDDEIELAYEEREAEVLYEEALRLVTREDYEMAAATFDEVERQHPYSEWARRAQLMSAFSHYQVGNYDNAVLTAQRFLALHPGNRDAPYAYYLIAISHFEQIVGVGRDQTSSEQALTALLDLIRRYPNSEYARDARVKLDLTMDHLAGREMEVGRYYQNQGQYLGAIHRFRNVVVDFQTTSHVAEALHRLTECYLALGVRPEAQASAAVLGHNFPGSDWYEDSYALLTSRNLEPQDSPNSWISNAFSRIF